MKILAPRGTPLKSRGCIVVIGSMYLSLKWVSTVVRYAGRELVVAVK